MSLDTPQADSLVTSADRFKFRLLIALAILFALSSAVALWCGWLTKENVRALVAQRGGWAPVAYVLLASLLGMAWVPRWLLTAVAGALFGIQNGALLGLMGGLGGALGGYVLGWKLGNPYVSHRTGNKRDKTGRVFDFVSRHGFTAILLGRVCPAISCQLVSLSAGAAGISLVNFSAATVLGMAPGSLLYAAFGASILDPDSKGILVLSLLAFGILSLIAGTILWSMWKRDRIGLATE